MADSKLIELEKRWFDFTSRYVTKLSEAKQDWNALSEEEQELTALWKLEMDMYNGGFIQFFCNWGYTCYTHAIRCLAKLKATQVLEIVNKQYQIIERLANDDRIEALWDIPKYLTEAESKSISSLDCIYWENTDSIMEKTFEIYKDIQTVI